MIRIKVSTRDTERSLTQINRDLDDLRPLWELIRREYVIPSIDNIFKTDGRGTWAPTSRPNPILRDTRRLFKSYTIPGASGNINEVTRNRFRWGSNVPYAQYHEFPDRAPNLPVRAVVELLTSPAETMKVDAIVRRWTNNVIRRA